MILGVTFRVRDLGVAVNTALSRAAPRRAHISTVPRKPVYQRPQPRRRRSSSRRHDSRQQGQQQNSRNPQQNNHPSFSLATTATTQLANCSSLQLARRLSPLCSRFSCSLRSTTSRPATRTCSRRPQNRSSSRATPCLAMHARFVTQYSESSGHRAECKHGPCYSRPMPSAHSVMMSPATRLSAP